MVQVRRHLPVGSNVGFKSAKAFATPLEQAYLLHAGKGLSRSDKVRFNDATTGMKTAWKWPLSLTTSVTEEKQPLLQYYIDIGVLCASSGSAAPVPAPGPVALEHIASAEVGPQDVQALTARLHAVEQQLAALHREHNALAASVSEWTSFRSSRYGELFLNAAFLRGLNAQMDARSGSMEHVRGDTERRRVGDRSRAPFGAEHDRLSLHGGSQVGGDGSVGSNDFDFEAWVAGGSKAVQAAGQVGCGAKEAPVEHVPVAPGKASDFEVGEYVFVCPGDDADDPYWLAKVISIDEKNRALTVHWMQPTSRTKTNWHNGQWKLCADTKDYARQCTILWTSVNCPNSFPLAIISASERKRKRAIRSLKQSGDAEKKARALKDRLVLRAADKSYAKGLLHQWLKGRKDDGNGDGNGDASGDSGGDDDDDDDDAEDDAEQGVRSTRGRVTAHSFASARRGRDGDEEGNA